ncbi:hypothetical protein L3X38_041064 [Prunus dulcis]|uniref:Uncharacterized protein n=1 Tax=Prunus dulcis TaxID=3755 RepID=A0AAD4UTP2_PRUDU|nr:hypothetical protein L3X38_041064 [Prunus dulcis]
MGVDDFFNSHGDADFDSEPDPELGSSFDDPDSEDDPDPHSDDDPNPEFVSDSDLDPDFDFGLQTSIPNLSLAQIPIEIPTQPVSYASSAAQIMTSRLTTPTHGPDCAYCGDPRHTCETCFKSHGYPNWWATLTDRGQCTSNGKLGDPFPSPWIKTLQPSQFREHQAVMLWKMELTKPLPSIMLVQMARQKLKSEALALAWQSIRCWICANFGGFAT